MTILALRTPGMISVKAAAAPAIGGIATSLGSGRVMLVTSRSLVGGPLIGSMATALGRRLVATYGAILPHSPSGCVLECARMAAAAEADLIVAVGGGSVIDAAKVVRLCLSQGIHDVAGYDRLAGGGTAALLANAPGLVAVPTTLSAAEFTPLAGITNAATGRKDIFGDASLIPDAVVMDPEALSGTPVHIVATTGIRAIDHCIEGYCSIAADAYHDSLAISGLGLLLEHLPAVVRGPQPLDVFAELQMAAWMAVSGPAAGVPLGASHGIGRVLGAVSGMAHGHTSAVLLSAVLRWNANAADALGRQHSLLRAVGAAAGSVAELVEVAVRDLELPGSLSEMGVERADLPRIARDGLSMLAHPSVAGNARAVRTEGDVREILELAW